ncbi:MAG: CsgG/HfaB family protein [bacterium]
MNKFLTFLLFGFIVLGCSSDKIVVKISTDKEFKQLTLAVLDFDIIGQYKNRKLSTEIGDALTEALFHHGYKMVVDRSRVRDLQRELKIITGAILTKEQISLFKSELNADYLLLGSLTKSSSVKYQYPSKLSFRVLSTRDSKIYSFVSIDLKYNEEEADSLWNSMSVIADKWVDSID